MKSNTEHRRYCNINVDSTSNHGHCTILELKMPLMDQKLTKVSYFECGQGGFVVFIQICTMQ